MTDAELQAIRKRCERASPGPWQILERRGPWKHAEVLCDGRGERLCFGDQDSSVYWNHVHDGRFVANARVDIPLLLAKVDQLLAANEALRETLAAIRQLAHVAVHQPLTEEEMQQQLRRIGDLAAEMPAR